MTRYPRLPVELFRFATTERAELNTAVLYAFGAANERLETWLTLGDLAARLQTVGYFAAPADEDLVPVLDQLREWQLIDRTQDHAAHYSTAEDFERNNLRYSLTRRGEAALEGFSRAAAVLEATGALQTAVLDAIAERLDELAAMLSDPTATDRRVYSTLAELEGHLESLVAGVKQFNGELQRLLRDDSGALDTFHEVKQATIAYLQEFVTNLDHRQRAIAASVARIEAHGLPELQQRALRGADLPALPRTDPSLAWLEQRTAKWDGLRAWFRPADGSAPRAAALQDVARRAIVALMRVLERHTEA
ncbi:MAG: TIGR02677 family protein, partial [Pseudonocardiaceae bacterium]